MNSKRYQIIFSTRLNALVVVGENCTRSGKSIGESSAGGALIAQLTPVARFIGCLTLGLSLVSAAFAEPLANALPVAGAVAQGVATISQSANAMVIHQDTSKAIVNWQSFDIGSVARVNVIQPSETSVLLNRVVGNNPSQIFGSLDANGQVILVNPNGILFGKDGSVNANAFTASTLDMRDADFMAGNYRYFRTGVNGEIVNQGGINTQNYVALLGAKVSNDGSIHSHGGNVYLGAAEAITVPVSSSGRIKMELSPASINIAVENTQNGVIVTQGGQVFVQASAINDAVASVTQSGLIDAKSSQGGSVTLLSSGNIRVNGMIDASSANLSLKGGDVVIGRDVETGALAKMTDVSGATLTSNNGFVETSGDVLKADGVNVQAADWLLDPYNITIATSLSGTAYAPSYTPTQTSTILASDVANSLNSGTNVTLTTGTSGSELGDITISAAIVKSGSSSATLTLRAANSIMINNDVGVALTDSVSTGQLNLVLTATNGSISQTAGKVLSANNLYITSGGAVGSSSNRMNTSVANLSVRSAGDQFITEANNVTVAARTTANNGSVDIKTTNGTLIVGTVNGISGVTAHGAGNINLFGNAFASTANGMEINAAVTASGGLVSLTGITAASARPSSGAYAGVLNRSAVSARDIILTAKATDSVADVLGYYGAGAAATLTAANTFTANASSAGIGDGFYMWRGAIQSGAGITLAGSSQKDAIKLEGVTLLNSGIGSIQLSAPNGAIYGGSVGATQTVITQNANGGVILNASYGNVTVPKIIDNGAGNVVIAAGSALSVGVVTGGQVKTLSGNNIDNAIGNTYVYSGSESSTGVLSYLDSSFNKLQYESAASLINASFNKAYPESIRGGARIQALFRQFKWLNNQPFINPNNGGTQPSQPSNQGAATHVAAASSEAVTVKSVEVPRKTDALSMAECVPTLLTGVNLCFLASE